MIPIAFYAPLKSPDHDTPSGDRTMGRLLLAALQRAGFSPSLASRLRSLDLVGDAARQADIRDRGEAEAARLLAAYRMRPSEDRPRLWFTYHCYYKAPDWIGPQVAAELAIPYVVAEGSRSARRAVGPWALGHDGSEAALDQAEAFVVLNPADSEDMESALRPGQRILDLPPFLDPADWALDIPPTTQLPHPEVRGTAGPRHEERGGLPARLLTVAMTRPGDKLASYRLLAQALALLPDRTPWTLDIVGDGPARAEVEALFAPSAGRVAFRGALHDTERLADLYRGADLLVWPACGEAYGMTLLEAQACGCPVLAGREGGVPAVMRDGETGCLVTPRDAPAFAAGLDRLLGDRPRLRAMGLAASAFVRDERGLDHAAGALRDWLHPLVTKARLGPALASP